MWTACAVTSVITRARAISAGAISLFSGLSAPMAAMEVAGRARPGARARGRRGVVRLLDLCSLYFGGGPGGRPGGWGQAEPRGEEKPPGARLQAVRAPA